MAETILLVENEYALRELMRRFLEGSGYAVLNARDGDEALSVATATTSPSRKDRRHGRDDPARRKRIRTAGIDASLPRGIGLRGAQRARRRRGAVGGHGPPHPDRPAADRRRDARHERVCPGLARG